MSRNLARAVDLLQAPMRRAPVLKDVKDDRCPKCGSRGLAKIPGEGDLNCIICGAVIYEALGVSSSRDQVA